jgi:hypothetical protein
VLRNRVLDSVQIQSANVISQLLLLCRTSQIVSHTLAKPTSYLRGMNWSVLIRRSADFIRVLEVTKSGTKLDHGSSNVATAPQQSVAADCLQLRSFLTSLSAAAELGR